MTRIIRIGTIAAAMVAVGICTGLASGEGPDWSLRRRGGWDEFLEARRRLRRTLAADAETARLKRLWSMPSTPEDVPRERRSEPPDA